MTYNCFPCTLLVELEPSLPGWENSACQGRAAFACQMFQVTKKVTHCGCLCSHNI